MHHPTTATDVDPKELERSQETWHGFTQLFARSLIAIICLVVFLAWATL